MTVATKIETTYFILIIDHSHHNMSKQPQRRLKTGNRRRLPVRRTSHNRSYMALSHQQAGYMIMVQKQIRGNWIKSIASLSPLYMSLCAYFIAKSNPK